MHSRFLRSLMLLFVLSVLAACGISTTTASTSASTTASTTASTSVSTSASTVATTASSTTTALGTTAVLTTLRQFTLVELAAYNGDGGTTAYIAVNGVVYDVTNVSDWTNGWHKGVHLAGTDATAAFADSPHSASFLNQLDIVGTLVD